MIRKNNNLVGIAYTLLHALAVSLIYVLVKQLTKDIKSAEVVFLYKFTLLLILLPYAWHMGVKNLATTKLHLHIIRATLSTLGSICLVQALKTIDVSDVTAATYMENVAMVIIGILAFKEHSSLVKIIAISISCIGMVFVLYPSLIAFSFDGIMFNYSGMNNLNPDYIKLLAAVSLQLMNWVVINVMSKTESNKQQLFYLTLFSSISAFAIAFINWRQIEFLEGIISIPADINFDALLNIKTHHIYLIVGTAIAYLIHTASIYLAFQKAELSVIAPYDYSRLIFSGICGFIFFNQLPHPGSYIGYMLIITAGVALARSENNKF